MLLNRFHYRDKNIHVPLFINHVFKSISFLDVKYENGCYQFDSETVIGSLNKEYMKLYFSVRNQLKMTLPYPQNLRQAELLLMGFCYVVANGPSAKYISQYSEVKKNLNAKGATLYNIVVTQLDESYCLNKAQADLGKPLDQDTLLNKGYRYLRIASARRWKQLELYVKPKVNKLEHAIEQYKLEQRKARIEQLDRAYALKEERRLAQRRAKQKRMRLLQYSESENGSSN